ncbi:MAG: hypothetical protein RLZZ455_315 [Candidatus Parcubacteria bacterium]|jgi:predicted Zn-dependent protease
MKVSNRKHLLHLSILILVGATFVILAAVSVKSIPVNQQAFKIESESFIFSQLNFSIDVPSDYVIEEKYSLVILKSNVGEIAISNNGTNFETIDQYLNDLGVKNHFSLTDKEDLVINSYPAAKLIIGKRVDYFIYATEWTVYTLSTDSEALYDDLDQIARSFRYIPQ